MKKDTEQFENYNSVQRVGGCGDWTRTNDLQVMSLASYQLLPLRDINQVISDLRLQRYNKLFIPPNIFPKNMHNQSKNTPRAWISAMIEGNCSTKTMKSGTPGNSGFQALEKP